MSQNGHRDVIIRAPAAKATRPVAPPTPEEIIQFQAARIRELEAEAAERTVAASTIANVAICLLDRINTLGFAKLDGSVLIPSESEQNARGRQLTVSQHNTSGDIVVRVREKEKPAPIAWEDGRDD